MSTRTIAVFGPRFMLAMLLATFAFFAHAQDATDSVTLPEEATDRPVAADASTASAIDKERDELEPGVTSAALAADVTRQQANGQVMDRLELGRTEITGNQELPKVLYIVPWQRSGPGDLMGRPVRTLLDEVLAPLDRGEFTRQVEYYGDLYGQESE
jgi:hypothetical protein